MRLRQFLVFIVLSGVVTSGIAGEWYSAASFVASYTEIHDIDTVGAPLGPLNTDGRADEVVGLGLAIGHAWEGALRAELEYVWRYRTDMNFRQSLENGQRINGFQNDIRTQQLMANVFADLWKEWRWSPYIGAGAGVVHHGIDTSRSLDLTFPGGQLSESSTDFAWTIMAGVLRDDFYHGKLQIGYRFADLGELRTARYPDGARFEAGEIISHEIVVGWQLPL